MSVFRRYMMLMLTVCCWFGLAAQHYQIGDVYTFPDSSQGVVFYLLPDGSGGWVVDLHDAPGTYTWGNNQDVPGIPNQSQTNGVLNDTAGYARTQALLNFQGTTNNYASGAVDFANGWYLPTAMQLRLLHGQWPLIRNSLIEAGGSDADMSNALYWSSSENNNKRAYKVFFLGDNSNASGYFTQENKSNTGNVRAVRNFTYPVYQWSTGSHSSSITVNPTQTTTYQVTVSNSQGCDTAVSYTIVVPFHDTVYYNITACDYFIWYGDTLTESGEYWEHLSDAWGCDSVEVLNLAVNITPQVVVSFDTVLIEEGDTVMLHVSGADHYQWYPENSLSDPNSDNPMAFPSQSTYYHVEGYRQITEEDNQAENVCPKEDSVLVLVRHHVDSAVCNNDLPVLWGGLELNEADTVEAVFTSVVTQLDSIVMLYLTVNEVSDSTLSLTLLENDLPLHLNDSTYYGEGVYLQTLTNAQGCDSLLTIELAVIYNVTTCLDTTICADMLPFDWDNTHHFESADTLRDTLYTTLGADSVVMMVLHVMPLPLPTHTPDTTKDNCLPVTLWASNADSLIWKSAAGVVLSSGNTLTVNPESLTCYYLTTTNLYAVDSVHSIACRATDTICVEVLPPDTTILPVTACNYYLWYGDSLTVSGDYPHTLPDVLGCDSVVVLHLMVNSSSVGDTTATFCGQFDWYEHIGITEDGDYTHTFTNAVGCDSVVTLHAQLLPITYFTVHDTVPENDMPVTFNGYVFSDEVSDTSIILINSFGCDSVISYSLVICQNKELSMDTIVCPTDLPLQWNGMQLQEAGTHQANFLTSCGADSIVYLQLSLIDTALQVVTYTEDFCREMSAELSVITGLPDYVWSTGETTPQITVTTPGAYFVTASQGDCRNSGRIMVDECEPQLFLPNSITPSRSDGLNDVLSLPESQQTYINDFEIRIFNRWGEQIFYSTDKHFQWNGEFKGKITYNAVYVYVIRYTDAKGKPYIKKGSVTVL